MISGSKLLYFLSCRMQQCKKKRLVFYNTDRAISPRERLVMFGRNVVLQRRTFTGNDQKGFLAAQRMLRILFKESCISQCSLERQKRRRLLLVLTAYNATQCKSARVRMQNFCTTERKLCSFSIQS